MTAVVADRTFFAAIGGAIASDECCNDGNGNDDDENERCNDSEPPLSPFAPWVRPPSLLSEGFDLRLLGSGWNYWMHCLGLVRV